MHFSKMKCFLTFTQGYDDLSIGIYFQTLASNCATLQSYGCINIFLVIWA